MATHQKPELRNSREREKAGSPMPCPSSEAGLEALNLLKSSDPPLWLAPSNSLSEAARTASQYLFSALKPFTPKSPFDRLLVEGFDAEQIWQQIDLQSQPLLSSIRRDLKRFERNPEQLLKLKVVLEGEKKEEKKKYADLEDERDGLLDEFEEFDEDKDGGEDDNEEEEEEDEEEEEERGTEGGIEDGFLKIKELEEFLDEDEAREYGLDNNKRKTKKSDEDEESDEEDDDELGDFNLGSDQEENARYEDLFGPKMKKPVRKTSKSKDESEEDSDLGDEEDDEDGDEELQNKKTENLSTHQKQLEKIQSEIEQMERANLEPKSWTMQGEVTAAKRPKNSALEVDLDFEHNVRPAPVITEEVTLSLEELIKKRVTEEHFDDVPKARRLPTKGSRETKELDDNKSQKGLGEVYEEEYVQKTNLAAAPSSFSDENHKEASILFKKLCLKLDALSHFHFTPKPVIEDMSIQANVPALAMEEIAPLAVSDAAMLAPEEVFSGKGDIKEEAELTQSERKRRRANNKRKFKANTAAKKARYSTLPKKDQANEGS